MMDVTKAHGQSFCAEKQRDSTNTGKAMSLRDCVHGAQQAIEQLSESVVSIAREFERSGGESVSLAGMLQDAGRDLFTVGAHLGNSEDQAKVFTVLGSCAQGAAMQQALDILEEMRAEREALDDDLDYKEFDPESLAVDRIAVEHNVTTFRAGNILGDSMAVQRCTRIWNVLIRGEMSAAVALRIANELEHVLDSRLLAEIQDRILAACLKDGKCVRWSSGMTKKLHRIINTVDPDALKREDTDSKKQREVRMWPASPTASTIAATLPAIEAEAVWSSVDNLAQSWAKVENERRTLSERRADALVQMVTGIDKRPEGDCTPIGHQVCTPNVTLVADLSAEQGRQRAFAAKGSTTRQRLDEILDAAHSARLATVPLRSDELGVELSGAVELFGQLVARLTEEVTYTPSTALRRLVIERDGSCRFPGCQVAASKCDLDHVIPFNHNDPLGGGLTREGNLIALCRHHHRDKTHNGTTYRLMSDGTVWVAYADGTEDFSAPTGHRGLGRTELGLTYSALPENYRELVGELAASAAELAALCSEIASAKNANFVVDLSNAPADEKHRQRPTKAERRMADTLKHRTWARTRKQRPARARRPEYPTNIVPGNQYMTSPRKPRPKYERPESPPF